MSPARDDSEAETGTVLSPDELDIEDSDSVVPLDEGRYVIGAGEKPSVPKEPALASTADETSEGSDSTDERPRIDSEDVRRWLEDDLDDVESRYGFHISAKSEDAVGHQRLFSDDVGTVFDGLLMWYAQQVDGSTPVEDVLGILLMESNVRVRYSPRCFRGVLETHDLSPDDSIADLFEAMRGANGLVFPPETDR
ncbi:DUF7500 family protein [Haladaptatus salinisoli]|uniref:DUF7500 family protein n=1 Tax=Haladaptatus salinisoli TaxID=2884876 RepID=UPI001D09E5B0|nr:hypothetical protein [Haladaptatus salinisoli]